jgi:hypothetical protein
MSSKVSEIIQSRKFRRKPGKKVENFNYGKAEQKISFGPGFAFSRRPEFES